MTDFFATATFSDDVRQEVNGKKITIGEYAHDIIVPSFPASIGRLFVNLRVGVPASYSFEGLELVLDLPGGESKKQTVKGEILRPKAPAFLEEENDLPVQHTIYAIVIPFTNLELVEAGFIRCYALLPRKNEPLKAGRLMVATAEQMNQGAITVGDRDISAIFAAIGQFYVSSASLQKDEKDFLARCIFERLRPIGEKFSSPVADQSAVYSWVSDRECVVWFPRPLPEAPNVKINVSGADKYEVLDINRFGFRVIFDMEEGQTVSFEVLEPSFSD